MKDKKRKSDVIFLFVLFKMFKSLMLLMIEKEHGSHESSSATQMIIFFAKMSELNFPFIYYRNKP